MGETVRTASVLEIYNEAMKVLGDEKKNLLVEIARLKSKSFLNNVGRSMLLGAALLLFIGGFLQAPIFHIFFIAAVIFYFKKPVLLEGAISKTKSFFNNLRKNPGLVLIVILVMYIVFTFIADYFRILESFLFLIPAALIFYFVKIRKNQHGERIIEINNRLVEIDSEIGDLKIKKDAMLKQSLSEADEFLSSKE